MWCPVIVVAQIRGLIVGFPLPLPPGVYGHTTVTGDHGK